MDGGLRVVWRWVWCVIGVLVAGCNGGSASSGVPVSPLPTLRGYSLLPLFTPSPVSRLLRTPSRAISATGSALATPQPILIVQPTCYETPGGALWCLGLIRNLLSYPVAGVTLRLTLVDSAGNTLLSGVVASARLWLPPGEESPFGLLFERVPEQFAGVVAELESAKQLSAESRPWIALRVAPGVWQDGQLTVTVVNPVAVSVSQVRVIVTLLDRTGAVVGYRVALLSDELAPGQKDTVQLNSFSMSGAVARVNVTADGQTN